MNKIKKLFSAMVESVKKALDIFPITTIIIFILTLIITFFVIGVDLSPDIEEIISHILCIGGISAFGTWFSESLFDNKKDLRRIISYIVSFVIAIIFDRIIYKNSFDEDVLARWLFEYIIVCIFGTIYVLSKKSKIDFEKYTLNLLLNLNQASLIFWIIALGFLFLYGIFVILILETLEFEIFLKILCLFAGFYYIPVILKSFTGEEAEDTKFNKTIFMKVLLPLLLLAMLIIYAYIVKIFILTDVPKNQLFMILSVIFAFAFPIYIINRNYMEKDTFSYKINRLIPYLYIPFIFLQIYSMGLRIKEYGLTPSRYMAIILIIFEVFSIFLSILKNSKYLKEIFLVTIAISVIVMIGPLNFKRVTLLSQKAIVDKYVESGAKFDELADNDKMKFAGAYQYIQYDEDYINSELSEKEKKKLSSYNIYGYWNYSNYEYNDNSNEILYLNFYKELDNLNVSEYSKIYKLPYTYFSTSILKYENNKIDINIDLHDYIKKLIKANELSYVDGKEAFERNKIIKIDENTDLYLTKIYCNYNNDTKEVEDVNVEGYILKK